MSLALLAALWALACQSDPGSAPAGLLEKHEASFGGQGALESAGDLYLEGTLSAGAQRARVRSWIRREPFALREELELPGQATQVFVTDGEHAWGLDAEGEPGLLRDFAAISLLDWATFASYAYLDRIGSWLDEPVRLPDPIGVDGIVTGRGCVGARLTTPPGTSWILGFDPEDGRLLGMIERGPDDYRWKRFGAWTRYGPLVLPAIRASGWRRRQGVEVFELERVETNQRHAEALFAGAPWSGGRPELDVLGALRVVRGSIPGSAILLLPDVRLDGVLECVGQIDTAVSVPSLEPELAARVSPPPRSFATVRGGAGTARVGITWLDVLDLGAGRLLQLPVHVARHPPLVEILPSMQPGVTVGGSRWNASAPVLDLSASQVLRRARPAIPLKEMGKAGVIEVPYVPFATDTSLGTVEIQIPGGAAPLTVLLDTGFAPCLRVSARGLERAGLSSDRDEWLARGAIPIEMTGVGGVKGEELLVQLEAFSLGPLTFEKPWILIGLGFMRAGDDPDGLLGAGALLAFTRVGLDLAGKRLELEPGPGVDVLGDGRFRVLPSGEFAGLTLVAPREPARATARDSEDEARSSRAPDASLPRVGDVYPGTPAARAGLARGDLLVAIDGRPCEEETMDAVCSSLWLVPGTETTLLVRRGELEHEILLVP